MKIVTIVFWLVSWMLMSLVGAESVIDANPQDHERLPALEKSRDIPSLSDDQKEHDTIALPSGLRYQVLRAGSGDSPQSSDIVTVHHRGRTLSGKTTSILPLLWFALFTGAEKPVSSMYNQGTQLIKIMPLPWTSAQQPYTAR